MLVKLKFKIKMGVDSMTLRLSLFCVSDVLSFEFHVNSHSSYGRAPSDRGRALIEMIL